MLFDFPEINCNNLHSLHLNLVKGSGLLSEK